MKIIKIFSCIISLSLISSIHPRVVKKQRPTRIVRNQPSKIVQQQQKQPAALLKTQELKIEPIKINYGIATAQNKRPYQEDRFTHVKINDGEFFGVYDGHLGDKASSHLQENLHTYFTECLINKTPQEAFKCAFLKAENYALKNFDDGSTVVVAYIDKNNLLHFAWAGDSRAVLEKNGIVDFATQDHKPSNKDELNRIILAGGKEEVWRRIEVSRSIGNRRLKNALKDQSIALPEYAEIKLTDDNHFLIMASDGLWDAMTSQEAIDFVKEKLKKSSDLNNIALALQNEAIRKGSQDNITVCIIAFNELKKIANSSLIARFWSWLRGS